MNKTPSHWPVCYCCGDHCSPTGAWAECCNPDTLHAAQDTALRFVTRMRGRICDLPGHTLDLIAVQLPEHRRNYELLPWKLAQSEEGGRT